MIKHQDLSTLIWHEACEATRFQRLLNELSVTPQHEPVHVTSADLVIIDGAHRSSVLRSLGHSTVHAHLVDVPNDAFVAGWTHVLPESAPIYPPKVAGGPVVALLREKGVEREVRSSGDSPQQIWEEMWRLYDSYKHLDYWRSVDPVESNFSITWTPPVWGLVVTIAKTCGVLPVGVTRMAPILDLLCPGCENLPNTKDVENRRGKLEFKPHL